MATFKEIGTSTEIADEDYLLTVHDGSVCKVAKADANVGGETVVTATFTQDSTSQYGVSVTLDKTGEEIVDLMKNGSNVVIKGNLFGRALTFHCDYFYSNYQAVFYAVTNEHDSYTELYKIEVLYSGDVSYSCFTLGRQYKTCTITYYDSPENSTYHAGAKETSVGDCKIIEVLAYTTSVDDIAQSNIIAVDFTKDSSAEIDIPAKVVEISPHMCEVTFGSTTYYGATGWASIFDSSNKDVIGVRVLFVGSDAWSDAVSNW